MSEPLSYLADEVTALREQHLYRPLREMTTPQGPTCEVDGREVISFSSNDYLGLANHPVLKEAAHQAVDRYGAQGRLDVELRLAGELKMAMPREHIEQIGRA